MGGYAGKILRVNLTTSSTTIMNTSDYTQWGGGHGIGSAIFWDLIQDRTLTDGFDPRNVVTIMASPLSGTLVPGAGGRTEVQGIGVDAYPTCWFTRSNFGGRFSGMLKYAGWDGIVIEGKASSPVWVDIRNDSVQIRDANWLWGLDAHQTQMEVRDFVSPGGHGHGHGHGWGTVKPAILTIGAAGENQTRMGSLIHDAGNGAGQGGFGGVWGSKNLKAISVMGTGAVEIADPNALMEARLWANTYGWDPDNPVPPMWQLSAFGGVTGAALYNTPDIPRRSQGCLSCHRACRSRRQNTHGNESSCFDMGMYNAYDQMAHGGMTEVTYQAADLSQAYGINNVAVHGALVWLHNLHTQGIAGPGLEIDTDLPFDQLGELSFLEEFMQRIVNRQEIGEYLAEGCSRAAQAYGRLDEDLATGTLPLQYWGYTHHYDARTQVDWGYSSILGSRDSNLHDFNWPCYWMPSMTILYGLEPPVSAEVLALMVANACSPYSDPMMADYSDQGIYSESMAKTVAWSNHYAGFWKQSLLLCDWAYPDIFNYYGPNMMGLTPQAEPAFFNAVTGQGITFEDGMETGRRLWNLDRAIWVLQGRHRDQEVFADYAYDVPSYPGFSSHEIPYIMPVYEDGEWQYGQVWGRALDRDSVEQWKSTFYEFEGWDPTTGWPTRATLESLGLGYVADELQAHGKLGG